MGSKEGFCSEIQEICHWNDHQRRWSWIKRKKATADAPDDSSDGYGETAMYIKRAKKVSSGVMSRTSRLTLRGFVGRRMDAVDFFLEYRDTRVISYDPLLSLSPAKHSLGGLSTREPEHRSARPEVASDF